VKLVHASILLLALAGSSPAFSQSEGQPEWIADARQVAAQEGISVGEAVRRFQLSEKAGRLQDRFLREDPDTFAGMEIVASGKSYRIKAYFTADPAGKINAKATDPDLKSVMEGVEVRRSLGQLASLRAQFNQDLRKLSRKFMSWTDVTSNVLVYGFTNLAEAKQAMAAAGIAVPDGVRLEEVAGFPVPIVALNGGSPITNGVGQKCTTSFAVRNYSGVRGIASAGHCPRDDWTYNATALTTQLRAYSGNADIMWLRSPTGTTDNFTYPNVAYLGPTSGNRTVTSVRGWSLQLNNDPMCWYGQVTNTSICGNIFNRDVWWDDPTTATVGDNVGPFVWVKKAGMAVVCQGGDSGGPVMSTNSAAGMMTNCSSNTGGPDMYYMPADRFNAVSVVIQTTP
jgi:hypothetical protein